VNYESLPLTLRLLIDAAASAGVHGQTIYHIHADVNYKALSAEDQALVNKTYYEAVEYAEDWEEEENNSTVNNLNCLI
jgi:hypothetical protein